MKGLLLISLLFVASCGVDPVDNSNTDTDGGGLIPLTPKLIKEQDPAILARIVQVCAALESKENFIRNDRSTSSFGVKTYNRTCSDVEYRSPDFEVVKINSRSGIHSFEYQGRAGNTPIPEVESYTDGVLSQFCFLGDGMTSPRRINNNQEGILVTVLEGRNDCVTDTEHVCIHVAQGPIDSEAKNFTVRKRHYVRFYVGNGNKRGFYTSRSYIFNGCADPKKTEVIEQAFNF